MKSAFAFLALILFATEASAQYPIYLNRNSVQYGYRNGPTTYYFNGYRQPAYWSWQSRQGNFSQQHYFRGQRRVYSVYGF